MFYLNKIIIIVILENKEVVVTRVGAVNSLIRYAENESVHAFIYDLEHNFAFNDDILCLWPKPLYSGFNTIDYELACLYEI